MVYIGFDIPIEIVGRDGRREDWKERTKAGSMSALTAPFSFRSCLDSRLYLFLGLGVWVVRGQGGVKPSTRNERVRKKCKREREIEEEDKGQKTGNPIKKGQVPPRRFEFFSKKICVFLDERLIR